MKLSTLGNLGSTAIAFIALLVSIISLQKTNKFNARQSKLADTTERLNRLLIDRQFAEEMENKKADLSTNLYKRGQHSYSLKLYNKGKGTARNVRLFDLDSKNSILHHRNIEETFPVDMLEQHQSVDLIALVSMNSSRRTRVKVIWDDDAGQDHEKELTSYL
jgi:hypothetical protein